jgi:hypothetical protein
MKTSNPQCSCLVSSLVSSAITVISPGVLYTEAADYPDLRESMDAGLHYRLMTLLRSEFPAGEAVQVIKAKRMSFGD